MVIDAALRRLAGRLSAMQLDPGLGAAFAPVTWRRWRGWIGGSLQSLSTGVTAIEPRPPLPHNPRADALGRIGRQIELMAVTIERVKA